MSDLNTQLASIWTRALRSAHHSVILDLGTPDEPRRDAGVDIDPDRAYSGASMIKTFLAEMVSEDVDAGRFSWGQSVQIRADHLTGGDGVLPGWQMPATIALHDLVHLMVIISDNSATNVVADLLGTMEEVNDRLATAGITSRMRRWVGGETDAERANDPRRDQWSADPSLPSTAGLSVVSPRDHHEAMWRMRTQPRHRTVWRMFEAQQDRRGLVRHLDDELTFARKTGTDQGVRHDGGILPLPDGRTVAITVFTDVTDRVESVDHPSSVAIGQGMRDTLHLLGHGALVVV